MWLYWNTNSQRIKRMERMKTDDLFASASSVVSVGNSNEIVTEIALVKF